MIRIEALSKHYKNTHALKGVNLCVAEGELFAYPGPNGAGKITTIRILTGLTKLSSGTARLNGFHIESQPLEAKRQCGLVPQSVNPDQELTVFENPDVHGRLFHIPAAKRREKIDELLEYVDMSGKKDALVKHLSGGMKRRIMIARALVHSPKILFLDEPSVGLDANIRRRIWALIKKIQQNKTSSFLTTAGRVAFPDEGCIVADDTPLNLISALGTWSIDRFADDAMNTVYFKTREEADEYRTGREESFTLRRVNLEDVFLKLTGKKVSGVGKQG